MLVLIMFFLDRMQSGPATDFRVHALGYAATAGLLGTTLWALRGRLKRQEAQYRHSHETDWLFLVMLVYVAATGILQHLLHRAGFDLAANITYVLHLMGVVPMLALEVPFSKWAHLAYRPLAMYFAELRANAIAAAGRAAAGSQAAPAA
jgi:heterodisulfide reductase subunit C/quinone-modifying oxidoreductase subunit QmoC